MRLFHCQLFFSYLASDLASELTAAAIILQVRLLL